MGTASSYTGNTVVNAGVLAVGVTNAFNTAGSLTVNSGATFRMSTASANQTFTGLDGSGTFQWTVGATNNPRLTLNVASGTSTFSGVVSSSQLGNQRVASITKTGAGTQVFSNGAGFLFDRALLSLTGGTLQLSANNQFGYVQISGSGGTLELNGNNQSIDTWAAGSTVTNSNGTTSTLSSAFNGKAWTGNIAGNIRIQNGGAFDTDLRGTNSFTRGVNLNQGAFTITTSGQLPANQIDFSGGSLDFSNANITLASDRTYTVGAGGGSFRYRTNTAGGVNLQGAINDLGIPGILNFVTHPSFSGTSIFTLSGGGNFSGTTRIGGSNSVADVTLRSGATNGISTNTILDFGGGTNRTYSLDLNGFSQQVAGLTNTGTGVGLVQRVITSSAAASQVFTVNNSANHTFSGILGGVGTNNNNFGFTKSGNGSLTLSGTNTYTGATTVSAGTLLVNGSLAAGSAVSVASGAALGGSGTINGTTTILSGGTLSPGTSPGLSTMGSTTLNTGSDFVFELIGNTIAGRGTNYDGVNILTASTLTIQSGVTSSLVFNVGSTVNWSNTFWATDQQWLVFDTADNNYSGPLFGSLTLTTDSASQTLASIRSGASFNYSVVSGDIFLNYTAIPEPSTYAMLGLGLAALVWLRRKNKNNKA